MLDLTKLDEFLELPAGMSASVLVENKSDNLKIVRDKLATCGIEVIDKGFIRNSSVPNWKSLLRELGITKPKQSNRTTIHI